MKLQEFFDSQKNTGFTDIDKLDLYQNILYKKTKKTSLKRSSFVHAKYFVYSMIFVILVFGLYGVYFINDGSIREYMTSRNNTVQADYIAQVTNSQGKFFIEHNGVLTTDNNISNGDTIILKENTQLVFEINSGTQSKIIGPAKLTIQKTEGGEETISENKETEKYKLNLVYGDFIQMEGKKEKSQHIELAINNITVKQEDKSQAVNFTFIKEGENQVIQNKGENIVMTKSNGEDTITTINKEEIIAIKKDDIKVFANLDSFTKIVEAEVIQDTIEINEDNITNQEEEIKIDQNKKTSELLQLLTTTTTIDINTIEEIKKPEILVISGTVGTGATTGTIGTGIVLGTTGTLLTGATTGTIGTGIAITKETSGTITAITKETSGTITVIKLTNKPEDTIITPILLLINEEQEKNINKYLNPNLYNIEIKDIETAYLSGELETFSYIYSKLNQRIDNIYKVLNIPTYTKIGTTPKEQLLSLISAINKLSEKLTVEYSNASDYSYHLHNMTNILTNVMVQKYGSKATPIHQSASGEDIKTTQ